MTSCQCGRWNRVAKQAPTAYFERKGVEESPSRTFLVSVSCIIEDCKYRPLSLSDTEKVVCRAGKCFEVSPRFKVQVSCKGQNFQRKTGLEYLCYT